MYMIKCHVLIYLGYHPTTTARHKNTVYSALNKNMSKAFSFNCCLYCWKGGRVVIQLRGDFNVLVLVSWANSQTNKKSSREGIYAGNGDLVSLNKQR